MTNYTADTLSVISTVQAALSVLTALEPTAFRYPPNCPLTNLSSYDYIIVGGGTAGSVLAYRLSTDRSNTVLLIDEGTYPPLESEMAGLFILMPEMSYDYNIPSINDGYTAQTFVGERVDATQGKMLGGSSNIDHMIYIQGDPHDYNQWASMLDDDSWSYESVLPEFKKIEKLVDSKLLSLPSAEFHGTDGMIKTERLISNAHDFYYEAFAELGHKIVDDLTSNTSTLGVADALFTISDNIRQNNAYAYLGPAKSRSNLCLALSTKATKILIEDNTAVGLQVLTSSAETLQLYANKEVIISAGAIHSPQLLMLSGIGPKEHLESLDIPVVADLPVGENFMDHPSAVLMIKMGESNVTAAASNPYQFPIPTHNVLATVNSSQTYPDYQAINIIFPHDSAGLMQFGAQVFKFKSDLVNSYCEANVGHSVLFVVHNLLMPKSRGKILLASADHTVKPKINTGVYSNYEDVELMGACLEDYVRVLNTTNFQSVNAELVDLGLCPDLTGTEYWQCMATSLSGTMWHYAGTCSMGLVTDSKMAVKGIDHLRVCDASSMPTLVSGNIKAAVTMIGERCASNILNSS